MKQLVITIAMIFVTAFVYAKPTETLTVKTQIYCSHCLQCNSCGANINDHIRKQKGIKKVNIDPKANTIIVTYDADKTNPDEIRKAINNAGYDADDKKASNEQVNKLDGCCKKR